MKRLIVIALLLVSGCVRHEQETRADQKCSSNQCQKRIDAETIQKPPKFY